MRIICFLLIIHFYACQQKPTDDNLLWAEEFDTSETLSENWNIAEGNGCPDLCGFGNNELQFYTQKQENLKVKNGHLLLTATREEENNLFYSAKISTEDKQAWKHAYIEVKAKLPSGRGTWPAIWMLPSQNKQLNWPLDGEIDIMEHVGYNMGTIYGTIHTEAFNHLKGTQKSDSILVKDVADSFHVYAIDWQENYIHWYVDNKLYHQLEKPNNNKESWPFTKDFYLILNLAVGGNWGGKYGVDPDIFPQSMEIDYVRVYKNKPNVSD